MHLQGRPWWCECGRPYLWTSDVQSQHCSQHLVDPYSLTHVLHGFIFYGILALTLPRVSLALRFMIATMIEAAWEVVENTDFVIDRYRDATMALGYRGDSDANSLADIVSCMIGFALARKLGLWWSVAVCLATEIVLAIWIRDNLFLNVVMLIYPIEAVKTWQTAS